MTHVLRARVECFFSFPRSAWECKRDALRPIKTTAAVILAMAGLLNKGNPLIMEQVKK
jgi:hypothetical protein